MSTALLPRLLVAAFIALAGADYALAAIAPTVIVNDTFDDGIVSGPTDAPGFWTPQSTGGDQSVAERGGKLVLNAQDNDYAFASIMSRLDPRLNFFAQGVTVSVEDFAMDIAMVQPGDAFFRISINATEQRQNATPSSVTLRIAPGLVVFGFKTPVSSKADAEYSQGADHGARWSSAYEGTLKGLTLTLDPLANPGLITCTVVLKLDGPRPFMVNTCTIPLRLQDWNANGYSALILEGRRNVKTREPASFVRATLGRVAVSTFQ